MTLLYSRTTIFFVFLLSAGDCNVNLDKEGLIAHTMPLKQKAVMSAYQK